GSRVREALACDIRRGTVHGFEYGAFVADVARGREAQPTDQPGAHVGQDVAVQIRHHQNLVVVGRGIRDDLQAGVVEQLGVKVHFCEILADVAGRVQEQSVGHLHDCRLVYRTDLRPAYILGVLESESEDALRGFSGDEFDALNDAVDDHMLDPRVLSFGVLADEDCVNIVVWGFVAGYRFARADVGEEVECSS
ncbi:MAG: hypothetical protein Q9203_005599, partial [Teloschistes exilis]